MKIKFYSLAGALLAGLFSFWELTFGVTSTNHIYGMNFFKDPALVWWLVPAAAAAILLFFLRKRLAPTSRKQCTKTTGVPVKQE